ncbi:MAG TPA: hypothetical protein RMG45_16305, partial [Polyangiaceae bacterium LLY-WYZ-15_(1-7)]|nr:hypothetical protein [Polyangiaceae bacterium LLY-WYZ-15_(1-7)]
MRTVRPPAPVRVLALALLTGGVAGGFAVGAQQSLDPSSFVVAEPGAPGTNAELRAWSFVRQEKLVKAREAAEEVVREDPRSYVGHFVLAYAHHYGEANFPKALYHANRAEALFTERHGREPPPGGPWRWHARLLLELAAIHGDLEHYEERLGYLGRYNEIYDPDVVAEQAWALMKQGRFEEARRVARAGLATNDPRQVEIALNALCAVEFEAGNDGESYVACRRALEHARSTPGDPNAVDLTNFAEAARSMFRLAEAERVLLEATEAPAAWYGNPWLELAELYTRGARFPEALDALERVPGYRAQRPPHVRESDRNEHRRALAAFFLTVGRSEEALEITRTALVAPDRRAHNSRDPAQDRAVVALLDRSARLAVASRRREAAAGAPVWERALAWAAAGRLRFEAWMSGRQAVRLLSDDDRFVGLFRIGTARSAIVPPW